MNRGQHIAVTGYFFLAAVPRIRLFLNDGFQTLIARLDALNLIGCLC